MKNNASEKRFFGVNMSLKGKRPPPIETDNKNNQRNNLYNNTNENEFSKKYLNNNMNNKKYRKYNTNTYDKDKDERRYENNFINKDNSNIIKKINEKKIYKDNNEGNNYEYKPNISQTPRNINKTRAFEYNYQYEEKTNVRNSDINQKLKYKKNNEGQINNEYQIDDNINDNINENLKIDQFQNQNNERNKKNENKKNNFKQSFNSSLNPEDKIDEQFKKIRRFNSESNLQDSIPKEIPDYLNIFNDSNIFNSLLLILSNTSYIYDFYNQDSKKEIKKTNLA